MARRSDGLDLGLWEEVSPAKLIIPLDTHLFRISAKIGLTRRSSANWAAAREVTQNLRLLDPSDPVKYDFAWLAWESSESVPRRKTRNNVRFVF